MLLHCRFVFITKKAGCYNRLTTGRKELTALSAAKRLRPTNQLTPTREHARFHEVASSKCNAQSWLLN